MNEEKDLMKSEQKVEKNELRQNNSKKKGIIAGCVAGGAVALALGLGLGLGLKGTPEFDVNLSSDLFVNLDGEGTYKKGTEVTIEAETIEGYKFLYWNFNNKQITANPYVFELTEDTAGTYEAVYEKIQVTMSLYVDDILNKSETVDYGTTLANVLPDGIDEFKTAGFYLDENYSKPIDLNDFLKTNTTIYTKMATLDKLTFALNSDGESYAVSASTIESTDNVVIPKLYTDGTNAYPVTSISESGFEDCVCESLFIPYGVKKLEKYSFCGAEINKLEFPESINYIRQYSFESTNINVYYYGDIASWCDMNLEVNEEDDYYYSAPFADNDGKLYVNGELLTELVIPEGVIEIKKCAFYKLEQITSVTFPETLKTISNRAFYYCKGLTKIEFSDNIEFIGIYAFGYTAEDINFGKDSKISTIGQWAFSGCELKNFIVPNHGIDIYRNCFENITSSYYTNLNYNTYKNGIYFGNEENPYSIFMGLVDETVTSVELHPDTKSLPDQIFYQNANRITEIIFPNGIELESLGGKTGAFYGSQQNSITNYTVKDGIRYLGSEENPYMICYKVDDSTITEIKIPETTKFISLSAFDSCYEVTSIELSDNIKGIGEYAFNYCTNLESIKLPSVLKRINAGLFNGCEKLSSIEIPESVEVIDGYAFNGCQGLTSIKISSNIKYVFLSTDNNNSHFSGCKSLATIIVESDVIYNELIGIKYYNYGEILKYATTVKVLKSVVDNEENINVYLNNTANYTKTEEGDYYIYTKVV